jgi:hypothetical protein
VSGWAGRVLPPEKIRRWTRRQLRKLHKAEQELSRVKAGVRKPLRPAQPALILNEPEIEVYDGATRAQLTLACSDQVPVGAEVPQSGPGVARTV